MIQLTEDQVAELSSLAKTNAELKGPTFMSRHHWRGLYAGLVRAGLVEWGKPPKGFGKSFAGVEVTAKGREFLGIV